MIIFFQANGSILATPIIQLIRGGDWQPQNLEAAILSQTSKLCFLSAFVFLLVPDLEILYPVFVSLFIAVELSGIDVFKPFEDFSFGLFKKVYIAVDGDNKEKNDWILDFRFFIIRPCMYVCHTKCTILKIKWTMTKIKQ